MDIVKIALVLNIIPVVIALVTAFIIAWENAGSRNLALAGGALFAATVLFVIQLPFEFRESRSVDLISTELTIDKTKPEIRQWVYSPTNNRVSIEVGASSWLAGNNPEVFSEDPEKLTADLLLFSLVAYFADKQWDWQLSEVPYAGSFSTMTLSRGVSKSGECTTVTEADLRAALVQAANLFSDAPSLRPRTLCLPPKSSLLASPQSLSIHTPFCQVTFDIDLPHSVEYGRPGIPRTVENHEPQFETRVANVRVETTYFRWRAQHREMSKYRDWCSRLVSDAREWFQIPRAKETPLNECRS